MPDQRMSRCPYCGDEQPSAPSLPFFVDRSEGSGPATNTCKRCRCYPSAHVPNERWRQVGFPSAIGEPHAFEAHGAYETDQHYCGCRGWE